MTENSKSIWQQAAEMERPENGGNKDTGYIFKTTFWQDFKTADRFGVKAVQDTFDRAFKEWKDKPIFLTELVLVLNWRCWEWYETNDDLCNLYRELYDKAAFYADENTDRRGRRILF